MICVVPYFGGDSTAAHSARKNRLGYLEETLKNHRKIFSQIVVTVCNDTDEKEANSVGGSVLRVGGDPLFLPVDSMEAVAAMDFDTIYYTEADQKLYCDDVESILRVMVEDKNVFVIPRRMFASVMDPVLMPGHPKRLTLQAHSRDPVDCEMYNDKFYVETDEFRGFGGAWWCSRAFFEKIKFKRSRHMPIEHTSGFDLFAVEGSKPLMTIDSFEFWVDHLSARDMLQKREVLLA
jgi:hypothetical protein